MSINTAPSGVESLTLGENACHIYDSDAERWEVLASFVRCGLERSERIAYVLAGRPPSTVIRYLSEMGIDTLGAVQAGNLVFVPGEEERSLFSRLRELAGEARAGAWSGLRIGGRLCEPACGAASPEDASARDAVLEHERAVSTLIREFDCLVLCECDRRRSPPAEVLLRLEAHPVVVTLGRRRANPHYVGPEALRSREPLDASLDHALNLVQGRDETEERYRKLVEHSPDAVFVHVKGVLRYANPAMAEHLGVDHPRKLVGRRLQDLVRGAAPNLLETIEVDHESGEVRTSEEVRVTLADGRIRVYEISAAPVRWEGERARQVVLRDVTERHWGRERVERAARTLHRTVSALSEAVLVVGSGDHPRGIHHVNPAAEWMFGYSREDLVGGTTERLHMGRDHYERFGRVSRKALEEEGVYQGAFPLKRRDGTVFEAEQTVTLLNPEEGLSGGVVSVVRDVSEQAAARRKIRESKERFETLFRSGGAGMVVVRQDDLTYVDMNDAFLELIGYGRDELVGRAPGEVGLIPEEAQESILRDIRRESWNPRREVVLRRKDGQKAVVLASLEQIELDGERCVLATVQDITRRREAEDALAESERRFRQIAEHIDDVFWMRTPDGEEVLYLSPAYERVTGRPVDEVYADPSAWLDTVHPEDRAELEASLPGPDDPRAEMEYRIVRPDGEVRWIWDRAFPVEDASGEVCRIVGVGEDVTERKRLEEKLLHSQKMEAVGRLAGGIAHDFNNLLTVIRSQTDLALMDLPGSHSLAEELEVIRDSADRAARLTGQLLAFGREQVLEPRVVELNRVIEEMTELLVRTLGEDIEIRTELAQGLPPIRVDPSQLEQVIMNLAVNARDAMPHGGVLRVATSCREPAAADDALLERDDGRVVRLEVADTGLGMSDEVRERIFEPFFTTKGDSGGTGLGLATSYGIVRQSGGTIQVESEPRKGTSFMICLPASEDDEGSPGADRPAGDLDSGEMSGTILVVEDDSSVRRVARKVLERAGLEVRTADRAEEALGILQDRDGDVDLVLTDLVLQGASGRELVDWIRGELPDVKVVVMSGYAEGSPGTRGDLPEEVAFIQKPFSPAGLLKGIRRGLEA